MPAQVIEYIDTPGPDDNDRDLGLRVLTEEKRSASQGRGLVAPNPGAVRMFAPPVVMASPPTVTIGSANGSTQISSSVLIAWTDTKFRYLGGTPTVAGVSYPDTLMGRYATITAPNIPALMNVEFEFDGTSLEIYQKALGNNTFRIWVDGQPATADRQSGPSSAGNLYLTLVAFGSRANRRIRIEGQNFYFGGIRIGPADTLWPPSSPVGPRVALLGDSFGEAAGVGSMLGFLPAAGYLLGWRDIWNESVGSTGYANPSTGGKKKYGDRVAADIIAYNPDIVVVEGSVNDQGYTTDAAIATEAELVYQAIRTGLPNAILIVLLPFAVYSTASYDTMIAAVKAKADQYAHLVIGPRAGLWFAGSGKEGATTGSGNADYYRQSDSVHPTAAGQAYIGYRFAQAVAAAMPILGAS